MCLLFNETIQHKEYNIKGMTGHLQKHPAEKRKYEWLKKKDNEVNKVEVKKQTSMHAYTQVVPMFTEDSFFLRILGTNKFGE